MTDKLEMIRSRIRDVPDFPKPGILFKDITPLIGDAAGLAATCDLLAEPFAGAGVDAVAGMESRGFIFGAAVSLAHAGDLTLAVTAAGEAVGCDLEPVAHREESTWRDLLGPDRNALAELVAREAGELFDAAATRLWSAGECLKKAGLPADAPLTLEACEPDGWVRLRSGGFLVATYLAQTRDAASPLIIATLTEADPCGHSTSDTTSRSKRPTPLATSTSPTT